MKALIKISIVILVALSVRCAYEPFEEDFDYTTVYFANQTLKRSFVAGETNTIKIGIVLGGKRSNTVDEVVNFIIEDASVFDDTPYVKLPEEYFTLSSYNEFVIPSGKFMGEIEMTIDPSFYQDSLALNDHYALSLKLTDTSTDSILSSKDNTLLIFTYETKHFGNYYHNGRTIWKNSSDGSVVDTTIYHQEEPVTNPVNVWQLETVGNNVVYTRGLSKYAPSNVTGFYIQINEDNTLTLMEDKNLKSNGFDWQIEQIETNYYDPETKSFFLNYKFHDIATGYESFASDTLIFRNRILDGVNQWDF